MRARDLLRRKACLAVAVTAFAVSAVAASGQSVVRRYADVAEGGVGTPGGGPAPAGENQLSCNFHDGLCSNATTPCSGDADCVGIGTEMCTLGIAGDSVAYDNIIGYASDLNPGTPDGLDGAAIIADDFRFLTLGDITQLEWTGYYRRLAGGSFSNCFLADVENGDQFTILFLGDDGNGFPDGNNILFQDSQSATPARFTTGVDEGLSFPAGSGTRVILRNTYSFPNGEEFEILTGALRHLVVVNDTSPSVGTDTCHWWFRSGAPGNARAFGTGETNFTMWDELLLGDGTHYDGDMSYCFSFESSGALELQPGVTAEALGAPDDDSLCCDIKVTVQNRSFSIDMPELFEIDEFYVAVNKADGPAGCESLSDVFPPSGWSVDVCEGWSGGQTVLHFSGGTLPVQETVDFVIRTRTNDTSSDGVSVEEEVSGNILNETIPARGIRVWATKDDIAGSCGGAPDAGPQVGGAGEWGPGRNGICDLVPIPSATATGKTVLAALLIAGGLFLVLRSRSVRVA